MFDYLDYEDYYEPSEGEIFFDEIKEKFREILKSDVSSQIDRLTKENIELRKTVKEYNDKKLELARRENDIKYKEENYKREVEREFYRKTMEEVFENLLEDSEVWYAEYVPHDQPKCSLCDDDRYMTATFPNGEVTKKVCDCKRPIYTYEPALSINKEIKFHKSYNTYYDEKKIYFKTNHCPDKAYVESYDYYSQFKIERIFDVFDDEVKNYYESKDYGEKMAFRNKEACQQCCDWLNANKNNQR